MTSINLLPHENPEVVAALERAFQDVWAVLYAHVPLGDAVKEQSIALSQNTGRSGRRWDDGAHSALAGRQLRQEPTASASRQVPASLAAKVV
jgi:hypothetical protein